MHIVTFYSFKGGVGRTMALMNVAAELVRRGRRVLVVDFDLEAPGIETFDLPKPEGPSLGVVDYVASCIATTESPDVADYVYRCADIGGEKGDLWIMPAGKRNRGYGRLLNSIDWQRFYAELGGYLFIEDMKEQWEAHIKPDYVLLDSRTGYTDVGGICTRQLPDAVTIFFFPNEQNLSGLRKVVSDIRAENKSRDQPIHLHFAASNVPDLDDENRKLEDRLQRFSEELGYDELSATIHHYNSLDLLNQVIFTKDRERSRLAREYRNLASEIVRRNSGDREGALEWLSDIRGHRYRKRRGPGRGLANTGVDHLVGRLREIGERHPDDGEVQYHLALVWDRWCHDDDEALALLNQAVRNGLTSPEVRLYRARLENRVEAIIEDVKEVLGNDSANLFEIRLAVRLLEKHAAHLTVDVPDFAGVKNLDAAGKRSVAEDLWGSREGLKVSLRILRGPLADEDLSVSEIHNTKKQLSLALIGLGQFDEARDQILSTNSSGEDLDISASFNLAVATWGSAGVCDRDAFHRVIELHNEREHKNQLPANYFQCLALAFWVTGDREKASTWLETSREAIMRSTGFEFSCWSYLRLDLDGFLSDLREMKGALANSEKAMPRFLEIAEELADDKPYES